MQNGILLVDDDHIFNFINGKMLQGMGISDEIHIARNGKEALTLISKYFSGTQSLLRIIFLDLNMPVMDGFNFIEAFKRLNTPHKEKVVIAVLTSSTDPQDVKRAKGLGIEHYLIKPLTEMAIRSVLSTAGVML
jgi:CheY-like chemotaxis protein